MGVNTCMVCNTLGVVASAVCTLPERKLGYKSALLSPLVLLLIASTDLRRALFGALRRLAGTLRRRRCFAVRFFLKRFFEPRGKNLPLRSLGNDLASFLPLATLLELLRRLRFFGGISSLFCCYLFN